MKMLAHTFITKEKTNVKCATLHDTIFCYGVSPYFVIYWTIPVFVNIAIGENVLNIWTSNKKQYGILKILQAWNWKRRYY